MYPRYVTVNKQDKKKGGEGGGVRRCLPSFFFLQNPPFPSFLFTKKKSQKEKGNL